MEVIINILSNERNKLFRLTLKDPWKIERSKIFKFWQKIYIYIYIYMYVYIVI